MSLMTMYTDAHRNNGAADADGLVFREREEVPVHRHRSPSDLVGPAGKVTQHCHRVRDVACSRGHRLPVVQRLQPLNARSSCKIVLLRANEENERL